MPTPGPIYLLADSRRLFASVSAQCPLWRSMRSQVLAGVTRAAYVGASNGDDPAFYTIFEAAMERIGVVERHWIPAHFGPAARRDLESADLIVLAGGDVVRGWEAMTRTGMRDVLVARHRAGAILLGISAGAMQLGASVSSGAGVWQPGLAVVPHVVEPHAEAEGWPVLRAALRAMPGATGLGIGWGGAVVASIEPGFRVLYDPVVEVELDAGEVVTRRFGGA